MSQALCFVQSQVNKQLLITGKLNDAKNSFLRTYTFIFLYLKSFLYIKIQFKKKNAYIYIL